MLKDKNGKLLKYIVEFILIFLIIFFLLLFIVYTIAYIMGIDVVTSKSDENEITFAVYKKSNRTVKNDNVETVNIYIDNDLDIDDENLIENLHTENDYFYNQLDEFGKKIYDKITINSEFLKSGDYIIEFGNDFNNLLLNDGEEQLKTSYKNAVDCIRYDRLDLFYIDFTKMYLKIEKTTRGENVSYNVYIEKGDDYPNYYIDGIENNDQLDSYLFQIENKRQEIINNLSGTSYQKVLYIHDYLVDNLNYDQSYQVPNNDNLIGAFLNGNVICEGYAKTFKYLLDSLEIPCILVIGDAVNSVGEQEKHMWNYVNINDGWYAVDVTWDDPILSNGGTLSDESRYRYFCRNTSFNNNHFSDGIISVNGKEFIYPELVTQ